MYALYSQKQIKTKNRQTIIQVEICISLFLGIHPNRISYYFIQNQEMKRPQSAKPGYKGNWGQASVEDLSDKDTFQKNPIRKQVKIMKPDLTTHDFGRILPRKIQQDKQRLYSQALQLKQNLNEITEENIRLKTKVSILEREKDKINRFIDTAPEVLGGKGSRLNIYQSRSNEKENMIIKNLKKIVRQSREENDLLKSQNQKIKKMMKYTKINEMQVQRKVIIDENKRLNSLLQDYCSQILDQEQLEKQNAQLRKYLQAQLQERQQLGEQKEKYEQIIDQLEEKLKTEIQKYQNKEKRLSRDYNTEKRKALELQKRNEQLLRQLKTMRENQQKIAPKPLVRVNKNVKNNEPKISNKQYEENQQTEQKCNQLTHQNQRLLKQLQEYKAKIASAESQLAILKEKLNMTQKSHEIQKQIQQVPLVANKAQTMEPINAEVKQTSNIQPSHKQEADDYDQDQYEDQFEKQGHKHQQPQIQKYKQDFQQNQQQQQLYKKEEDKKKKPHSAKQQKKSQNKTNSFKPNKKILAQIKQLLTYRMKSQRYPFKDIQNDIESAETSEFTYADLCNMLVNEPFYLTSGYTQVFLSYCYEKQKIQPQEMINNSVLISKLRKVIEQFELIEQSQQKEMIIKIAQMTSTYPRQLQVAFENIKNGEQTVSKKNLIEMFHKLQLEDKYIQLIIGELSLCSDDIQHLNFHGFFERFYIEDENEQEYYQSNAIQQEESEQSNKYSSRVKKSAKALIKNNEQPEIYDQDN